MRDGPAIQASGLTKYYGELLAVDHLDLEVARGECFGFLGPNGAGKTTTIKMMVGLLSPTSGRTLINGHDVRLEPREAKRSIGVVPEGLNLYGELSAFDNLIFMAQLYDVPRRERSERARALLKRFKLSERAHQAFGAYSRGLKRRLIIAAALVHEPALLFLDEPTTGLDVMSARNLRALIRELKQKGMTIFLTTHYIAEAEELCDRVGIIVGGRLAALDTPQALVASVQSANLLEADFDREAEAILGELPELGHIERLTCSGTRARFRATAIEEALVELGTFMRGRGIALRGIRTVKPSLEDAFVKITGLDAEIMQVDKPLKAGGGG